MSIKMQRKSGTHSYKMLVTFKRSTYDIQIVIGITHHPSDIACL